MSSEQLSRLEQLAGQRADRSRGALLREKHELDQMDQRCKELRAINLEYQQSLLAETDVTPKLLAQRRAFVEQLTQKLETLAEQRRLKSQNVLDKAKEHQHHAAQHAAVEIVNDNHTEALSKVAARREQQQMDASANAQHIQRQHMEREQGND